MRQWKYIIQPKVTPGQVASLSLEEIEKWLNEMGKDGWELIGTPTEPYKGNNKTMFRDYYFKTEVFEDL